MAQAIGLILYSAATINASVPIFSFCGIYNLDMSKSVIKYAGYSGNYLAQLRKAAGLSQHALATRLGVPQSNIAFWERSAMPPRSDILPLLAATLGVSVEQLLSPLSTQAQTAIPKSTPKVRALFDRISRLPRHQQDKLADLFSFVVANFELNISISSDPDR